MDIGAIYTYWGAEREQVFKIPIIVRERVVRNEVRLDDFEGFVGHRFGMGKRFLVRPYVGVEWGRMDSRMTINQRWEVLNRRRFCGPMVGVMVESRVWRYLNMTGGFSFSYLDGGYQRVINERVNFEEKSVFPRSKMNLGMEFVLPVRKGSLRVKGGYEMHYFWSKGVDDQVDWGSPLNLRGFVGEVSFDY